jgi:hypothetical protein
VYKNTTKDKEMNEKDIESLRKRLEDIVGTCVTAEQARQVAVFTKMFLAMGADFDNDIGELDALCMATTQIFACDQPLQRSQYVKHLQIVGQQAQTADSKEETYVDVFGTKYPEKTFNKKIIKALRIADKYKQLFKAFKNRD